MPDHATRAAAGVRVGVVSWNTAELLGACLAALPAALDGLAAEVVVVDNASADRSAEVADAAGVGVIRNGSNVGYARAMNQALAGTSAPVLIALNPDTRPAPGTLRALVERLAGGPADVGLVAPRLVDRAGRHQPSAYRFPSPAVAAAASFIPLPLQRGALGRHFGLEPAAPPGSPVDVDWAIGAVHVIRSGAVAGPKVYDERWFMYVEDLELCWRLARRGWRRRYEADVEVVHAGNASGRQAWGEQRARRWLDASYDWYARDRGRGAARRWAAVNAVGAGYRTAQWAAAGVLGRSDDLKARARELAPAVGVHARAALLGHLGGEISGPPPDR